MFHTPEPWSLSNPDSPQDSSILGADGELVIAGEYDGYMVPFACREEEEAGANARLIAAAPELLKALEQVEAKLTEVAHAFYGAGKASALRQAFAGWKDVAEPARILIKKARGE